MPAAGPGKGTFVTLLAPTSSAANAQQRAAQQAQGQITAAKGSWAERALDVCPLQHQLLHKSGEGVSIVLVLAAAER